MRRFGNRGQRSAAIPLLFDEQELLETAILVASREESSARPSPPTTTVPATRADAALDLRTLLQTIGNAVDEAAGRPVWVRCEVASLKRSGAGHVFLELQQTESGLRVARVEAVAWRSVAETVFRTFERGAGTPIAPGMRILARVRASFKPDWGMKLSIEDVDPSWTVGEAQRLLARSREVLRAEGLWDLNRSLPAPVDFTRVAVLAPSGSAGLGDFLREADVLQSSGLTTFDVVPLLFEGPTAAAGIAEALYELSIDVDQYDAVCIVRGGGATSSLAWLDAEMLSRAVCHCPIPVLTGIGHEKDKVLVDEVAQTCLGTPSKVIAHIRTVVFDAALRAESQFERLSTLVETALRRREVDIDNALADVGRLSQRVLDDAAFRIDGALREADAFSPSASAARGFPGVSDGLRFVRSAAEARAAGRLRLHFADGEVAVGVEAPPDAVPTDLVPPTTPAPKRRRRKVSPDGVA